MAFHIYGASLVRENGETVTVKLGGENGIPHTVTGIRANNGRLISITPQAAVTDDGAVLHVNKGDILFFDPLHGQASYDLQTLTGIPSGD